MHVCLLSPPLPLFFSNFNPDIVFNLIRYALNLPCAYMLRLPAGHLQEARSGGCATRSFFTPSTLLFLTGLNYLRKIL